MQAEQVLWAEPVAHLVAERPDHPVMYFAPNVLQGTARRFQTGFGGLVTYAVKANARAEVLTNLVAAGLRAFDVASPAEMRAVRDVPPDAVLHYNNPVRSEAEVAEGARMGVESWSVDDVAGLAHLAGVPRGEVAVRFALPVRAAAYDFGEKFGATPDHAAELLRRVADMGFRPALSFHPGTQCEDAGAWSTYLAEARRIAARADVRLARVNVGGGFAAHRGGVSPDLEAVFAEIACAGAGLSLVCEPGRAMVAEAYTLAARVKALRADGRVYLNDGLYGGLGDLRDMAVPGRLYCVSPRGVRRAAPKVPRVVFGPTCDSVDRLPGHVPLATDLEVGDYLLFEGMGAYSIAMSTGFNGYGLSDVVTVRDASGQARCRG